MNFSFTEEQTMLRDMVKEFAEKEILPGVESRENNKEFPTEIVKKAAELGLCGITVAEEYGGAGFDNVSAAIAIKELAKVCPSTAITLSVTNGVYCWPVEEFGTEEQKQKFLTPVASGEALGAFCLTEPDAGSDAGSLLVKAREDGDDFLIEGTKAWVTNGGVAGYYVVVAVTGENNGKNEITAFIVPADTPGLSVGKIEDKMGLRASQTTQIVFDDCRVPAANILGKRGMGLKVALATLNQSRIGVAAQALGIAQGAFNLALDYAEQRTTFGKPLNRHQAIANMLAEMAVKLELSELLTLRAADMMDKGLDYSKESSMAKYFASETAKEVADKAVQIHGAYGYSKEYPVERFYRDARVTTIYEGTSEIQKMVIARNMIN